MSRIESPSGGGPAQSGRHGTNGERDAARDDPASAARPTADDLMEMPQPEFDAFVRERLSGTSEAEG